MEKNTAKKQTYIALVRFFLFILLIYSGIILWEMVTREIPFSNISSFAIPISVIKGDRPTIPKDVSSEIKSLIKSCWAGIFQIFQKLISFRKT